MFRHLLDIRRPCHLEPFADREGKKGEMLLFISRCRRPGSRTSPLAVTWNGDKARVSIFLFSECGPLHGHEADIRERVGAYLQQEKLSDQRLLFVDSLRWETKIVVRLRPPPVARVDLSVEGAPFRGAAEAAVTLVEFSDFHCPFCKRVKETLRQLPERYRGKVRLVYRDFPTDSLHPQARRAAEAARCAHNQGKFWDYHDLLHSKGRASPEDLGRYTDQVGLDVTKFERCLSGDVRRAAVQRDLDEGTRLGDRHASLLH